MSWIRWQGVVAFVVLAGLVGALWLVIMDGLVKRGIEKAGTRMVGAKVELRGADLTLFPLGLTLTGLQVTNPDQPMKNAVEAERIAMLLDGTRLIERKTVVEEMTVTGVRLNTDRKTSGAVARKPAPEREPLHERLGLPKLEFPSAEKILEEADLRSLEAARELETEIQGAREKWRRTVEELPGKEKFSEYRERIETLKERGKGAAGALGSVKEFTELQKEISSDIEKIREAREGLEGALTGYREKVKEVAGAPAADVRRLMDKYSITPAGLGNMSRVVFGPAVGGMVEKALGWHSRLKPLVERVRERRKGQAVARPVRGEGTYVMFPEENPTPDFLIREAAASVEIPAGDIAGELKNITPDQDVLGRPTTFEFSGEKLKGLESLALEGVLDHVNPGSAVNTIRMRMKGYNLKDLSIGGGGLPLVLEKALADLDIDFSLGEKDLDADLAASFTSAAFKAAEGPELGTVEKAVVETLSGVSNFDLKARITGTVDDYDVKLSSGLDGVLRQAVQGQVRKQAERLRNELTGRIKDRVEGPLADLKGSLGGLEDLKGELAERAGLGERVLKEAAPGVPGLPGGLPKGIPGF